MAETSKTGRSHDADKYVSKLNSRCEKHLKKQIDVLDKEKQMRTKSLDAEKRAFQDRSHRLNMKPENIEHLSQHNHDLSMSDQNKELDKLLKNLIHRPYMTGTGYSYIEYLSRNMQPLVKRPLQWGINPPLPSSKTTTLPSVQGSEPSFLGQVKGQMAYLNQRGEVRRPVMARDKRLALPPIGAKIHPVHKEIKSKHPVRPHHGSYAWKTKEAIHTGQAVEELPLVTTKIEIAVTREKEPEVERDSGKTTEEVTPIEEDKPSAEEKTEPDQSMTFITDVRLGETNENDSTTPLDGVEERSTTADKPEENGAGKISAGKLEPPKVTKEEADIKRTSSAVFGRALDSRRHSV